MKATRITEVQRSYIQQIKRTKEQYSITYADLEMYIQPMVFPPYLDAYLMVDSMHIPEHSLVLDACSGSGFIALHAGKKAKQVYATDINPYAVENIKYNAIIQGEEKKYKVYQADIFPPVPDVQFDVITINPPYTNHPAKDVIERSVWDEDHRTIKKFFSEVRTYLAPNGIIYLGWADFADLSLIPDLCSQYQLRSQIIGKRRDEHSLFVVFEIKPD